MAKLKHVYNNRHLGDTCHSQAIGQPLFTEVVCEVIAATQHTFHAGFLEGVNFAKASHVVAASIDGSAVPAAPGLSQEHNPHYTLYKMHAGTQTVETAEVVNWDPPFQSSRDVPSPSMDLEPNSFLKKAFKKVTLEPRILTHDGSLMVHAPDTSDGEMQTETVDSFFQSPKLEPKILTHDDSYTHIHDGACTTETLETPMPTCSLPRSLVRAESQELEPRILSHDGPLNGHKPSNDIIEVQTVPRDHGALLSLQDSDRARSTQTRQPSSMGVLAFSQRCSLAVLRGIYSSAANKFLVKRIAQLEVVVNANQSLLENSVVGPPGTGVIQQQTLPVDQLSVLEASLREQSTRQVLAASSSIVGFLHERCAKIEWTLSSTVSELQTQIGRLKKSDSERQAVYSSDNAVLTVDSVEHEVQTVPCDSIAQSQDLEPRILIHDAPSTACTPDTFECARSSWADLLEDHQDDGDTALTQTYEQPWPIGEPIPVSTDIGSESEPEHLVCAEPMAHQGPPACHTRPGGRDLSALVECVTEVCPTVTKDRACEALLDHGEDPEETISFLLAEQDNLQQTPDSNVYTPSMSNTKPRRHGVVDWFSVSLGYGFVLEGDCSHYFPVKEVIRKPPVKGDEVSFIIKDSVKRPGQTVATSVRGGTGDWDSP